MSGKIFIYSICWLMRDKNRVLETTQHKLPMDLTHKLCKTDIINMNDIQLLNTYEGFAPDVWCHVEYKVILCCHGSRMVNEKLSFIPMLLINCQLRQIISAFLSSSTLYLLFFLYPPLSFYLCILFTFKVSCLPKKRPDQMT